MNSEYTVRLDIPIVLQNSWYPSLIWQASFQMQHAVLGIIQRYLERKCILRALLSFHEFCGPLQNRQFLHGIYFSMSTYHDNDANLRVKAGRNYDCWVGWKVEHILQYRWIDRNIAESMDEELRLLHSEEVANFKVMRPMYGSGSGWWGWVP